MAGFHANRGGEGDPAMDIVASVIILATAAGQSPSQAEPVGITRAVAAAERALGGRAVDVDLERSSDRPVYEIELVRGSALYEAKVDAYSGKILESRQPRLKAAWRRWFDSRRFDSAGKGRPLAELLAEVERQTSGTVREVELEIEHGRAAYDMEVATAAGVADVRIDALSGRRLARYDD
jgi:uncharacterized membrane protein YkoI